MYKSGTILVEGDKEASKHFTNKTNYCSLCLKKYLVDKRVYLLFKVIHNILK